MIMLATVVDRSPKLLTAVCFGLFFTNEKSLIFLGRYTSLLQRRRHVVMLVFCSCEPHSNYPTWKIICYLCFPSYVPQNVTLWGVLTVGKCNLCSRLKVVYPTPFTALFCFQIFLIVLFLQCCPCCFL